jgi:hypothetical protein
MKIFRDNSTIMRERQLVVSAEMTNRNISRKVVAYDSGIKYGTFVTYFPAGERIPSEIPGGALVALSRSKSMPDDLINILLDDGVAFVRVPIGLDYDEVSEGCRDYLNEKERAHHPESEAGRDLGPTEQSHLGEKAAKLRIVA